MTAATLGGRLPLLPVEALRPDQRALYDRLVDGRLDASPFRHRTTDDELIGPFNAALHAPAIGGGFIDFHEAEEHGTPLSPRMREIVILSVGAVWQAPYELYAHRAVATRIGLSDATVAALAQGEVPDELDEAERTIQRFTLALMRDRAVDDAVYRAAERAVGRDGLVAAVFLAGAYAVTCAVLNAFAVPAPGDGET